MIQLSHLVAWSYFKRLLELYLSPFCSITAKEIARFENGSTVWPKLPKKMRLPDLCQKSQEIANLCLLIHFVAKFCRHPKIWETRVVPGLAHPWLVLLRSWGLGKSWILKIKTWTSWLEDHLEKSLVGRLDQRVCLVEIDGHVTFSFCPCKQLHFDFRIL